MRKVIVYMLSTTSLILALQTKGEANEESNRVNIYLDKNMVCVHRSNKCWSFAKGSSEYPTPTWEGPEYLTTHIKNGFSWRNPLTGQVFNKGTHNLGNIWVEFYRDNNPSSKTYNWSFGFHQSPYPNTPLSQQQSHGCLRMTPQDLKEFSNSLNYLDEFYIIRSEDIVSSYLYNNIKV